MKMVLLLKLIRPKQWIKNLFLFAGLIFSRSLFDLTLLVRVSAGFVLFCLIASSVYVLNDIMDLERDKKHPEKAERPLAAGLVHVRTAAVFGCMLLTGGLTGAYFLQWNFFLVLVAYVLINVAYSLKLKHTVILDVFCIASGFLLRVLGGTVLAEVTPSDWLIICSVTLSLFLGFSKRRNELISIGESAADHRKVLSEYTVNFLDQMISVATATTVMSYALYTISPETVARFGSRKLILTLPFVLYGIYRYLYLSCVRVDTGNPTNAVFSDLPLLANCALWVVVTVIILY